jgi:hypothetical protein
VRRGVKNLKIAGPRRGGDRTYKAYSDSLMPKK